MFLICYNNYPGRGYKNKTLPWPMKNELDNFWDFSPLKFRKGFRP